MKHFGDNFIPVIPVDYTEHTTTKPFCFTDSECPCHEDQENINGINQHVQDGLLTPDEATDIVKGRTL